MNRVHDVLILCVILCLITTGAVRADDDAAEEPVLINNVFSETSIKAVLADLALESGYTIVPDMDLSGTVTLELIDEPFESALELVCMGGGYVWEEVADGVYLVGIPDPDSATFNRLAKSTVIELDYLTVEEVMQQIPQHLRQFIDPGIDRLIVTAPKRLLDMITEIVDQIDVAPEQVVIEAVILELTKEAADNFSVGAYIGATRNADGGMDGDTSFIDQLGTLMTGEAVYTLGKIRGKIGEAEVGIDALVEHGDARVHANPRVITSEGRPAEIQAGSDVYVTIQTGSVAFAYAQLREVKTGAILRVTPHVAANGEIILDIEPEVSGIVDRGIRQLSNVSLEVTVRRAKTQVRVPSGETIVLGGLRQERQQERRTKVPILGDVPLIGELFRTKSWSTAKTELVILITPYLYRPGASVEMLAPALRGLMEDINGGGYELCGENDTEGEEEPENRTQGVRQMWEQRFGANDGR